jgi:dihydrofolate reductase
MRASVFVGTSLDGFLARPDGTFDFLPADGGASHGYEEFFASVDALVIGRNTFDVVAAFEEWPYADKRCIVLTHRPLDVAAVKGARVERMDGTPTEILARLEADGIRQVYVDGGITIQHFLRAGLIDTLMVTTVPVLIGGGIPLFGSLPHDIALEHISTSTYAGGLVKSEYRVLR